MCTGCSGDERRDGSNHSTNSNWRRLIARVRVEYQLKSKRLEAKNMSRKPPAAWDMPHDGSNGSAKKSQLLEIEKLKAQLYSSRQKIKDLQQKCRDASNRSRASVDHHEQIIALEQVCPLCVCSVCVRCAYSVPSLCIVHDGPFSHETRASGASHTTTSAGACRGTGSVDCCVVSCRAVRATCRVTLCRWLPNVRRPTRGR